MTVLLSAGPLRASLGGIGERVIEGIEGAIGRDRKVESDAGVLSCHGMSTSLTLVAVVRSAT